MKEKHKEDNSLNQSSKTDEAKRESEKSTAPLSENLEGVREGKERKHLKEDAKNKIESSILAQDERWRRA